jgi:DNA-directed RNA polymerase specialized sigma24 family protein
MATGITARYSGVGGSSGSAGDRIGEAVAKIADIDAQLAERIGMYEEIIREIEAEIDGVEDHRYRQVLRFRYLNGWSFGKIARKMHYDRDYTYKIHYRALEYLHRKSQI